MTEIPKEFLVNEDTVEGDFPLLAEHLKSIKKKDEVVSVPISNDFPPDGCGIGIGSSYRDL